MIGLSRIDVVYRGASTLVAKDTASHGKLSPSRLRITHADARGVRVHRVPRTRIRTSGGAVARVEACAASVLRCLLVDLGELRLTRRLRSMSTLAKTARE